MINPDGVIYGNYRCSLLGVDLNRRWSNPSKILHPTIYNTKQLLTMIGIERSISLFCDIHGHSRKKNVFMYGCIQNNLEVNSTKINDTIRLLPYMLNNKNKIFSFKDCTFGCEKEKENTARIVVFKELGIINCYTLEASFFGSEALGKVVYETESEGESESHEEGQHEEVDEGEGGERDDADCDSPSKIEIKLPQIKTTEEEQKPQKVKRKKAKIVGDIHLRPFHLKGVGIDLCKTLFFFFNETVKLRKLQTLRKIRMNFNKTKINARIKLEKKIDKPIDQEMINKPVLARKATKSSVSPLKCRTTGLKTKNHTESKYTRRETSDYIIHSPTKSNVEEIKEKLSEYDSMRKNQNSILTK